jgi:diaminohydroxyphosphoribosylaminopyrimidine deaminase/5-amino-6-(5-phosphoribosylamino)uracil reductase
VNHEQYIKRCIELAQLAKGHTAPNPMVGAVLVHNGRVIGEGWHKQYGEAHAEVNCLESVLPEHKSLIPESTMYVSLEPCAHYGKTPPCALRLVQEKVKEVVISNVDPFAKVSGRGIELLNKAGIETTTGICEAEGAWLNRRFFHFHTQKRPYIILKWAQSAEGYMAPADGNRKQLSNKHSMQLVHKWRTEEAAIMVGYNTALADNPQLSARLWEGKQPLRIVVDRNLSLPQTHHLFDGSQPTWIVNTQKQEVSGETEYVQMSFSSTMLEELMQQMYERNILSIIIEGGAKLLASFIEQGLWNEARVFHTHTSIENGIAAPLLSNSNEIMETRLEEDVLKVFLRNGLPFSYPSGMEL